MATPAMTATESADTKGFFRSLYDFKFTSLIGARFLRFVYAMLVILLTIGTVVVALAALSRNNGGAVAVVVVVVYFLELIGLRIWIEFLIVFFQIGENVRAIRHGGIDVLRSTASSSLIAGGAALGSTQPLKPGVTSSTPKAVAGWFEAPGDPTRYRYWDGNAWTEQYSPKGGQA